jgi:hypothetical protein
MDDEEKKPCISTVVDFTSAGEGEGISFSPDKQAFKLAFEKLLAEMTQAVQDILPINQQTDLQQFINNLNTDSAPRFQLIVESSYVYQTAAKNIQTRLNDDFGELEERTKIFEKCRKVHEFALTFNFEDFKREHDPDDLEKIKAHFDQLNSWEQDVGKYIKAQEQKGLIMVTGNKMRQTL